MPARDLGQLVWRKSRHSGLNGCVEVGIADQAVAVRNSRNPTGPVLVFTAEEWNAFLAGVRSGDFTLPGPAQGGGNGC